MFESIKYEVSERIGYVTISRPKALNALNPKVLMELGQALDLAENDNSVGVIIITGEGEKAFVAGADIVSMQEMSAEEAYAFSRLGQKIFNKIYEMPKMVIAAINGFALGGGCELALACDIRIASFKAKMGIPEVTLGVFPGFGGTQRLPRLVGTGVAKEMLATGRKITADEAKAVGLVNDISENVMERAEELAKRILRNSVSAIGLGKKAINAGMEMELQKGLEHEAALFGMSFTTADQREGMTAFLEKRAAEFK